MNPAGIDVLFAVLPFADARRPALGVSILKPAIAQHGFTSRIEYLNIRMVELIGLRLYNRLANEAAPNLLIGEWFFADTVFGAEIPHEDLYVSKMLTRVSRLGDTLVNDVLQGRKRREQFLQYCTERIMTWSPKVVGFPTTFQQTCPCLAVAKRLKALPHPPIVVFGGANCEGEMGRQFIASFPWIDYVCPGEADYTFPELLVSCLRGQNGGVPAGVLKQGDNNAQIVERPVESMDSVSAPDFDDFFEQIDRASFRSEVELGLPLESARGCWWGAKHKCIFCGLNRERVLFRSKKPENALHELMYLTHKHNIRRVEFSDNILDLHYIDSVFPHLEGSGLQLFFETKANLRYDQLMKLRRAGVNDIQPGIESLCDEPLRLMNKGCTATQNIQLLRWSAELGIHVAWSILAGFPGESLSEYEKMQRLVPLLVHLSPPVSCTPIRLDRFSELFRRPEEFGLKRIRPAAAYFYVFPLSRRELLRLAYYFDYDYADGRDPRTYVAGLQREVWRWWEQWVSEPERRPKLDGTFDGDKIDIVDTREIVVAAEYRLTGLAARVYEACDCAQTVRNLSRLLSADESSIRSELDQLQSKKLLVEIDGRFLTLAVFRNRPQPRVEENVYGHSIVREATIAQQLRCVV
jgi:ribosomal peptide maturation radical SAM protein 1